VETTGIGTSINLLCTSHEIALDTAKDKAMFNVRGSSTTRSRVAKLSGMATNTLSLSYTDFKRQSVSLNSQSGTVTDTFPFYYGTEEFLSAFHTGSPYRHYISTMNTELPDMKFSSNFTSNTNGRCSQYLGTMNNGTPLLHSDRSSTNTYIAVRKLFASSNDLGVV
jgi:hypothetical protein